MIIGKEEPAINNAALFQMAEGNGRVVEDLSEGLKINRYAFKCERRGGDHQNLVFVSRKIIEATGDNLIFVTAWRKDMPGRSKIASRIIGSRLEKQGLRVIEEADFYYGYFILMGSCIGWDVDLSVVSHGMGLVALSADLESQSIKHLLGTDFLEFMSKYGYFIPTHALKEKAEAGVVSFFYKVVGDAGTESILFVSKNSLKEELIKNTFVVDKVYSGESAYKASL